jgi:arylformamidase
MTLASNPDNQPPLPFAAAEAYAEQVWAWGREPLPARVKAWLDLPFGSHPLQKTDFYASADVQPGAPLLVFWHGGGWTNGYRQWCRFMAPQVVARGAVLVTPSYRLAPAYPLPAALEDAHRLLLFLQRPVGIPGDLMAVLSQISKVVLAGHSAGGHIATMTALRPPRTVNVAGCWPISGIMDLRHANPTAGSLEERVYTVVLRGQPQGSDAAHSPVSNVPGLEVGAEPAWPPFVLTHGSQDSPRVMQSNRQLEALLRMRGMQVWRRELPAHDHFQTHTMLRDDANAWYDLLGLKSD